MSLRHAVRRGITVAVHSDVAILHAAAVTEFLGHIQRLVANDKREEAMELWQSVVEVVHFPPPPGNVLEALASHRCSRLGVPILHVGVASNRGAGSGFLGWGSGRGVVRSFGLEPPQLMHGVSMPKAKGRWTCSWWRRTLQHGGLETSFLRSGDRSWQHWGQGISQAVPPRQMLSQCGATGRWGTSVGWILRWRFQQGMKPSGMPSSKHNGPWPTGSMPWLRRHPTCLHHLACGVVRRPGECVQAASNHNAMNVSGQVTSGIVATRWPMPMRRRPSSTSLQCDPDKPGGTCLDSWSVIWAQREQAGGRGWTLMLLLSSLVMPWGGTPAEVWCMDDGRRNPSSSSRGDQVVDASNALRVAAVAHVKDWRHRHQMQDDSDFAFAFATFEEAVATGGHHLAAEWVTIRANQMEKLLPEAAVVVESQTPSRPSWSSTTPRRPPVKRWAMSKRRGVRLHPNPQETPEAIMRRVDLLGDQMMRFGALQPVGKMTTRLESEWAQACKRLSQRLIE